VLNEQDRLWVKLYFAHGPTALLEEGFREEDMRAFLARPEVANAVELLNQEFRYQQPLLDRAKFMVRRNLAKLGPHTVAVLGQSLVGPTYARDATGAVKLDTRGRPIMLQPAPTRTQVKAAEIVLERMGVEGDLAKINLGADTNMQQAYLKPHPRMEDAPKLVHDPSLVTEKERAVSRERIRNAIEALRSRLAGAKEKVDTALNGGKKPRRKAPRPGPVDTMSKPS
jgi:hypothetical protein